MNLNQVTIPVSDLTPSVRFYEALGLRLIVQAPPRYARFECPEGTATLSLHLVVPPINTGVWIYFEVPDVAQRVKELIAAGLSIDTAPLLQPWLWEEATLHDPDGQQIVIYHAGKNRKNPPWRLQPR